jgi:putative endonuclease
MRAGCVYIMASRPNGTIYIGVTSDLVQRVWQHRESLISGFTKRYGCKTLVWFEAFASIDDARAFERQMKKWNRAWKIARIAGCNPRWVDLYPELAGEGVR